jgi:hypothetical protein
MARYKDWEERMFESYRVESMDVWCSPEAIRELRSGRSPVLVGYAMAAFLPSTKKYDQLFNQIVDLTCASIRHRANISDAYWGPLGDLLAMCLDADQHRSFAIEMKRIFTSSDDIKKLPIITAFLGARKPKRVLPPVPLFHSNEENKKFKTSVA